MIKFFIRQLVWRAHILLIWSVIVFALMRATPGGPWDREHIPRFSDRASLEAYTRHFDLRKPAWLNFGALARGDVPGFLDTQFITYMFAGTVDGQWRCGFVCGNMGTSFSQRNKTIQDILFRPSALSSARTSI